MQSKQDAVDKDVQALRDMQGWVKWSDHQAIESVLSELEKWRELGKAVDEIIIRNLTGKHILMADGNGLWMRYSGDHNPLPIEHNSLLEAFAGEQRSKNDRRSTREKSDSLQNSIRNLGA